MISFHGKKEVKKKYVDRVMMHQKMDNLVRGQGWENGKGCAVGCTLEVYDHSRYPVELGIPEWLARLEDTLFEGMNEKKSRTWPEKFLKAIPVGKDLEKTRVKFLVKVLEHSLVSMKRVKFDKKKFPEVTASLKGSKIAVELMIKAQKSGDQEVISAARLAARSAARSAESAAESAAWSAESAESAAMSAARLAAWSAAWSAESAAMSAAMSAARLAAWSAESAARLAAWSAAYDYYADELLKILKAVK